MRRGPGNQFLCDGVGPSLRSPTQEPLAQRLLRSHQSRHFWVARIKEYDDILVWSCSLVSVHTDSYRGKLLGNNCIIKYVERHYAPLRLSTR